MFTSPRRLGQRSPLTSDALLQLLPLLPPPTNPHEVLVFPWLCLQSFHQVSLGSPPLSRGPAFREAVCFWPHPTLVELV